MTTKIVKKQPKQTTALPKKTIYNQNHAYMLCRIFAHSFSFSPSY